MVVPKKASLTRIFMTFLHFFVKRINDFFQVKVATAELCSKFKIAWNEKSIANWGFIILRKYLTNFETLYRQFYSNIDILYLFSVYNDLNIVTNIYNSLICTTAFTLIFFFPMIWLQRDVCIGICVDYLFEGKCDIFFQIRNTKHKYSVTSQFTTS